MECNLKKRDNLIADYLTGELSDEATETFEAHYFQCEVCFKELQVAGDAANLIERAGQEVLADDSLSTEHESVGQKVVSPRWSIRWQWGAIAGTAAAAAIIFLVFFTGRQGHDRFTDLSGPAFEPEPYLEEWVREDTRSGGAIIDEVWSPAIGETFENETVTFRWKMLENVPVTLKIFTNLEEEIFIKAPALAQFPSFAVEVAPETFPSSGLYYWRIEDKTNVLFVGKFYFLE